MKQLNLFVLFLLWSINLNGQFAPEQVIYKCPTDGYGILAVADLDADGINDLVLNSNAGSLLIGWGGNDDYLEETYSFDSSYDYDSIEAIDLDKDGDLDLIGRINNTVVMICRENLGDRSFATTVLRNDASYLGSADFDADGELDLFYRIGTELWKAQIGTELTLLNDQLLHDHNAILSSDRAVFYDFDQNGMMDIAFQTDLLMLQTTSSILSFQDYAVDMGGGDELLYEDIDEDGRVDIIGVNFGIRWLRNLGESDFLAPEHLVLDIYVQEAIFMDFTGNGYRDLIVKIAPEKVYLHEKTGPSTFSDPVLLSDHNPRDLLSLDIDQDGNDELIMNCRLNQMIEQIWLEDDVVQEHKILGPYLGDIDDLLVHDFDGNQLNDILACSDKDNQLRLFLQGADGHFEAKEDFGQEIWNVEAMAMGDLLSNGGQQIVFNSRMQIFYAEYDPVSLTMQEPVLIYEGMDLENSIVTRVYDLELMDMDEDGLLDIVFSRGVDLGLNWIRQTSPGNFFDAPIPILGDDAIQNVREFELCNYSSTEHQDIVYAYQGSWYAAANEASVVLDNAEILTMPLPSGGITDVGCLDVNGDGLDELACLVLGNGIFATLDAMLLFGGAPPGEYVNLPLDLLIRNLTMMELNGDAFADLVTSKDGPSGSKQMQVWQGAEGGSFEAGQVFSSSIGNGLDFQGHVNDIDLDQDNDLIVSSAAGNSILLFRNQLSSTELGESTASNGLELSLRSTRDMLDVSGLALGGNYVLSIHDVMGRLVHEEAFSAVANEQSLLLPAVGDGTFLLGVRGEAGSVSCLVVLP